MLEPVDPPVLKKLITDLGPEVPVEFPVVSAVIEPEDVSVVVDELITSLVPDVPVGVPAVAPTCEKVEKAAKEYCALPFSFGPPAEKEVEEAIDEYLDAAGLPCVPEWLVTVLLVALVVATNNHFIILFFLKRQTSYLRPC